MPELGQVSGLRLPSPRTSTSDPWHWAQPAAIISLPLTLSASAGSRLRVSATALA